MLLLREEQISILARAVRSRFAYEAYDHVQRYFPDRCLALGEKATMDAVRDGLKRAAAHGFQSDYDLLRYLNLLFEFGPEFERSEANAWALPHLEAMDRPPTVRMDLLMEEACQRLYPLEAPNQAAEQPPAGEFDGLVWEASGVDPNYVPQSITPEYEPIVLPPRPGSVPVEQVAPIDEEFELGQAEEIHGNR